MNKTTTAPHKHITHLQSTCPKIDEKNTHENLQDNNFLFKAISISCPQLVIQSKAYNVLYLKSVIFRCCNRLKNQENLTIENIISHSKSSI